MKDKAPTRNGTFSDADLAADCDERATSLETYLTDLAPEGMTAAMLTAFRASITAFRKLPTDDNLAKQVSTVVTQRDTALEAARSGLRQASQPISRAFGSDSAEFDSFDVGEVSRKSVTEVLNLLQTVPGVGTAYLTNSKAQAEGFTAARLAALPALYTALFDLETALSQAETTARLGTRTRILAYNALNTTCSAYCARGYDHFVELDAAKAHLFVRQPASHPAEPAGPVPPVAG